MAIISVQYKVLDPQKITEGLLNTVGDAGIPSILVDQPMCWLGDMSILIDINGQEAICS